MFSAIILSKVSRSMMARYGQRIFGSTDLYLQQSIKQELSVTNSKMILPVHLSAESVMPSLDLLME